MGADIKRPREDLGLRVQARAGSAEMFVYDFIGEFGIEERHVADELADLDAAELLVRINSRGGDANSGLAIFNLLADSEMTVTTQVDGLAASAASVIMMAGSERVMNRSTSVMIHPAQAGQYGSAAALRATADLLDEYTARLADIYAAVAGGTAAEWLDRMEPEARFNPAEAIEAGLATSMVDAGSGSGSGSDDDIEEELRAFAARSMASTVAALAQVTEPDPAPIPAPTWATLAAKLPAKPPNPFAHIHRKQS